MSSAGLAYERYRTQDSDEYLMRIGDADRPAILLVPPLFEEMNRCRALLVAIMRRLAEKGFGCWLPDLRGTGESLVSLSQVQWSDWRHDVSAVATQVAEKVGHKPLVASFRGGALIDDSAAASAWWRFAPVEGRSLSRDMQRAGLAGVEWAGYAPNPELKTALEAARLVPVAPLRRVQLASHSGEADARLPGPALWWRSEPAMSDELAEAAAADLAHWADSCAS